MQTKSEKIKSALKKCGEAGITVDELSKISGASRANVFGIIHYLRKNKHVPIETRGNKYFLKELAASGKSSSKPASDNSSGLPFPLPKGTVPSDKKSQFIDMIGQAAFYYRCAEALISSEQLKQNLSR